MDIRRVFSHLFSSRRQVLRVLGDGLERIESEIRASEKAHAGEICFVIEPGLTLAEIVQGKRARDRAEEVFSERRIWDTEKNNGVLVYLLLADHSIEIVADRGISAHVSHGEWQRICHLIEAAAKGGDLAGGVIQGIKEITRHLSHHYAATSVNDNELSDRPAII